MQRRLPKRLVDLAVVLLSLPLWLPLVALVGLLVKVFLGSPVLFFQRRPGLHGRLFTLVKFRTMTQKYDSAGTPRPDGERMTRFGAWLRSTSLDELPEIWNVIRGDMSLVGPRPLLSQYLSRYSTRQARRHEVLPGITGWAQVHGRNAVSWAERFELDVWYVDHQSVTLDMTILARTLWIVLSRKGIQAAGEATMPEFQGIERERAMRLDPEV